MKVRVPDYYSEFHCIADKCKHTCCVNWEIDVDDKTYTYYQTIEGDLGDKLRKSVKKDKDTHFQMFHGKCPFLTKQHLCGVYQQLGEQAMCDVCKEYPRYEEKYQDVEERILVLSCEEAGRILFTKKEPVQLIERITKSEQEDELLSHQTGKKQILYPELSKARDYCIQILQERSQSLRHRIAEMLVFSQKVQEYLNENQQENLTEVIENWKAHKHIEIPSHTFDEVHALFQKRVEVFAGMEVVEEDWQEELNNVTRAFEADSRLEAYHGISERFDTYLMEREYEYEHLMVYYIYRYAIEAIYDGEFFVKAKFSVLCYLMIRDMDRMRFLIQGQNFSVDDRIETSRIFSRQVEHSVQCLNYLTEKIKTENVFDLEKMLVQVME